MAKKPVTHKELEEIAEHLFDNSDDEIENDVSSSGSEFSEEEVEQQIENSDTEQNNFPE